jgi:hypothetical protein
MVGYFVAEAECPALGDFVGTSRCVRPLIRLEIRGFSNSS